jgi:hypothetical protein
MVCIVGEEKTPDARRNASDQLFEYQVPEADNVKTTTAKVQKQRLKALIAATSLLAAEAAEGWVGLGALGQYMRRTDPGCSPLKFGYSWLLEMVLTYSDLDVRSDGTDHWVQPKVKPDGASPGAQ